MVLLLVGLGVKGEHDPEASLVLVFALTD